jgi:hypothetical protein
MTEMQIVDRYNSTDFSALSSSQMPPEAKTPMNAVCRLIKKIAKDNGYEPIGKNCLKLNHFDASGHFYNGNKTIYVSICDPRMERRLKILYRDAKDEKDFVGGHNKYCNNTDLSVIFT